MIRAALIGLTLTLTSPALAAPAPQVVASVQSRLDVLGFGHVDARDLSTRQIAALHLQLQGRAMSTHGFNRMNTRSKVEVILGWD